MFNLVLVICLALFFAKYSFLISLFKIQLSLIRIAKRENFMVLWTLIEYFIYLWTFLSQLNRNRALFCFDLRLSSILCDVVDYCLIIFVTQSGLDISTYLYFHHLETFHLNEILARRPLYFCVIIFLAQKTRRFKNGGGQFNCPLRSLRGADHQSRTRAITRGRRMSCIFAGNLPGIFLYLWIILLYFTRDIYCLSFLILHSSVICELTF